MRCFQIVMSLSGFFAIELTLLSGAFEIFMHADEFALEIAPVVGGFLDFGLESEAGALLILEFLLGFSALVVGCFYRSGLGIAALLPLLFIALCVLTAPAPAEQEKNHGCGE
jgi:hypothetical protein